MNRCEDHYRMLISGSLDGELDPDQQAELDDHLATCTACQRELSHMQRLFCGTQSAFAGEEVPQESWDRFLDGVYNRMERKTGWILLILGLVALTIFGTCAFIMEPWGSALIKTLVAIPVIGLVILFVSVLRQRLESIKSDRYTKEVHR